MKKKFSTCQKHISRPAKSNQSKLHRWKDIAPPWCLFIDKGKPVAILAAGRPYEIADVSDLTMEEANSIVAAANAWDTKNSLELLSRVQKEFQNLLNSLADESLEDPDFDLEKLESSSKNVNKDK